MNAFILAKRFQDFIAREWTDKKDSNDPSNLYSYFEDWAQEDDGSGDPTGDLVGATGGNYAMGLQTWIVIVAWFGQRPEDFDAIREFVTMPLNLPASATSLPGLLDEGEWNRQVFERMCRS